MKTIISILLLLPKILFAQDFYSETTIYEYDDFNRLIHVVFEDGREYIYTYDELGNRNQISVVPSPDVYLDNAVVPVLMVSIGGDIEISVDHVYTGTLASDILPNLTLGYFISTDCVLDAFDAYIGFVVSNLGSDNPSITESGIYEIPDWIDEGDYYLLLAGDWNNYVAESNEINNFICIELTVTGYANLQNENENIFRLYPNPSNDKITITHSLNEPVTLNLYDSNGRLVLSQILNAPMIDIDISHLEAGIYHATIVGTNVTETKKIIKI